MSYNISMNIRFPTPEELKEGDSVTLKLDQQQGIFTAKTGDDPACAVTINNPDGFSPVLGPKASVIFLLGGLSAATSTGPTAFFEGAGADNPVLGINTPTGRPPTGRGFPGDGNPGYDPSRIHQDPVSVFK